jgi:hypothetical protein
MNVLSAIRILKILITLNYIWRHSIRICLVSLMFAFLITVIFLNVKIFQIKYWSIKLIYREIFLTLRIRLILMNMRYLSGTSWWNNTTMKQKKDWNYNAQIYSLIVLILTKHYLKMQLTFMTTSTTFTVLSSTKLTYSKNGEIKTREQEWIC